MQEIGGQSMLRQPTPSATRIPCTAVQALPNNCMGSTLLAHFLSEHPSQLKATRSGCVCTHVLPRELYILILSQYDCCHVPHVLQALHCKEGIPSRVISDNAQTFKSALRLIAHIVKNPEAEMVFNRLDLMSSGDLTWKD